MATAAELRAEAQELREKLQDITDQIALAEMRAMINELERLARTAGNGDATETRAVPQGP
jgi:hypothetical protein